MCRFMVVAALLIPSLATAELPTAAPADVGVSATGLEHVRAYMDELVEKEQVSGGVIIMARRGRVVLHEAMGKNDREGKKPMQRDAIFRIASMTKPITSVAVMKLVEEGKISLEAPVSKYIPEFTPRVLIGTDPKLNVRSKREITIRDLLRHTSGLTYAGHAVLGPLHRQAGISGGLNTEPKSTADMMTRLAKIPLAFHPGEQWHYGMSTDVLGRVVEIATQNSLDNVLRDRIFRPLGMTDTGFWVPSEKTKRVVALHYLDNDGKLNRLQDGESQRLMFSNSVYSADYPYNRSHHYRSGGGGLCSTASDYIRFCLMLANHGQLNGKQILKPDTVHMMTTNQLGGLTEAFDAQPGWDDQRVGFGLGFLVVRGNEKYESLVGSYQWYGAFSTSFCVVPKQDWALVVMLQTAWNAKTLSWSEEFKNRVAAAVKK